MSDRQGYYSVIQYSPVPDRLEFVNIGVVLFLPFGQGVRIKIEPDFKRINKVFGPQDASHIRVMKDSIQSRLQLDFGPGASWRKESIEKFVNLRSGLVQMSQPLPFLVKDAEGDLAALFEEMVTQTPPQDKQDNVVSVLKRRLDDAGVLGLVQERPAPIELPQAVTIRAPLGYRNGVDNLIDPVRLGDRDALKEASERAIKGSWLSSAFQHASRKKRLVVVGDLSDQPAEFASGIHELMKTHQVAFYDMDQLEPLIADIKKSASAH